VLPSVTHGLSEQTPKRGKKHIKGGASMATDG